MRSTVPMLVCGAALAMPVAAQDRGLSLGSTLAPQGPQWQTRLERDPPAAPLASQANTPLWLLGQRQNTLRLLGDYQFSTWRLGETGGLRLTGGVLLSVRQPGPTADAAAGQLAWGAGYAGVGYSSGNLRGNWGFSADLGFTGLGFGAGAPGGTVNAWGLRELRLAPQLRLGMNLAF